MSVFDRSKKEGRKELAEAENFILAGELDLALAKAKEALLVYRERGKAKEIAIVNAKILYIQGLKHKEQSDFKNAISALKQAGSYYKQAGQMNEFRLTREMEIELQIARGKKFSQEKKFDSAARSYEEAAIAMKEINRELESLEIRAKSYIFRAASIRNPPDRKHYLIKAVETFRDSGLDHPLVKGHMEYYSAMVEQLNDKRRAIIHLEKALDYYKQANNDSMMKQVTQMKKGLEKSLSTLPVKEDE